MDCLGNDIFVIKTSSRWCKVVVGGVTMFWLFYNNMHLEINRLFSTIDKEPNLFSIKEPSLVVSLNCWSRMFLENALTLFIDDYCQYLTFCQYIDNYTLVGVDTPALVKR
jgi:hypothetical protein